MAGDEQSSSTSKNASNLASDTAKDRLAQVSNHIAPNTGKRRRRKGTNYDLPADYSDILGQIATLRKIAATPDPNNRGYVKQKQSGKLWVRERVEQLLDSGSFQEVGSVSGTVKWKQLGPTKEEPVDYVPSNNVQGEHWLTVFFDTVLMVEPRLWTLKGPEDRLYSRRFLNKSRPRRRCVDG